MKIDDKPADVTEVAADLREAKLQDRKVLPGTARTLAQWLAKRVEESTALKALALGKEVNARAVLRELRQESIRYTRERRDLVIFIPSEELKRG